MRIAYVTEYDALDIHQWSGLGYFIARCLEEQGFSMDYIGSLEKPFLARPIGKVKRLYYRLGGRNFLPGRDPRLVKAYARQIERHPALVHADVIFSPGSIPVSYLNARVPIVIWTDATFAGMVDFYPAFSNLCRESIVHGNTLERSALERCHTILYSSEWAAHSATRHYGTDPRKVRVLPFGGNVLHDHTRQEVMAFIRQRDRSVCRLLFLAVDWYRKGGEIALQVAGELQASGVPVELHVAGCVPPVPVPEYVHRHGFLTKSDREGRDRLDRLMRESHFLLLPTRADATPLVINEACSYGLPTLASDVGGITSLIENGRNGYVFTSGSTASSYAEVIRRAWMNETEYAALCHTCFEEYENRLSWRASGRKLKALLEEIGQQNQEHSK